MLLPHVAELLTILSTQKMMTRNEIFDVAINSVDTYLRSSDHISQILNQLKAKELVVRHVDKNAFAITAKGKQTLSEHANDGPGINEQAPQPEPQLIEEEKPVSATNESSDVRKNPENSNTHRNPALAEMITEAFSSLSKLPETNPTITEIVQMQLAVVDKLQQLSNLNTLALKQDKIAILLKIAESSFIDVETACHLRDTADYLEKMA